ncbi:MAG: pantoate--beta-alanine ligase [Planctomycetes bacterium]|nr:pantoate--beta-alanine ligase [Planctomycetota bacterium]
MAAWSRGARDRRASIGFVPTMGALHEGHLSLVRRAVEENDLTCVSVFVNPLQFDDPRDLDCYPRDLAGDRALLSEAGCAMVFTGTLEGFFPEAAKPGAIERRDPGPEAEGLEGAFRRGHFAGVATICARLFELVRPRNAYFGEKDFQQCRVVERISRELGYPRIVVCPTSRDPDGLARSSRNLRLNPQERVQALAISRALFSARTAWGEGQRDARRLRGILHEHLENSGIALEYAEVRDPSCWTAGAPTKPLVEARALVAAKVGAVRLIDNLSLSEPGRG